MLTVRPVGMWLRSVLGTVKVSLKTFLLEIMDKLLEKNPQMAYVDTIYAVYSMKYCPKYNYQYLAQKMVK